MMPSEWARTVARGLWDRQIMPTEDYEKIAAALDAARREGAEAMREACASECDREYREWTESPWDDMMPAKQSGAEGAKQCAAVIRALPLPDGGK